MSKKKYLNPPKREDFEYFTDFTDFQIVMLCEMELLRKNKKYTRLQKTGIVYHPQRIKVSIVRRVKVNHLQRMKVNH